MPSEKMARHVFYVPIEVATKPANGECIADAWWVVHPRHGLVFYGPPGFVRPCPQCNSSRAVTELVLKDLYDGCETRCVAAVYMAHARRELSRLREARRHDTSPADTRDQPGRTDIGD